MMGNLKGPHDLGNSKPKAEMSLGVPKIITPQIPPQIMTLSLDTKPCTLNPQPEAHNAETIDQI